MKKIDLILSIIIGLIVGIFSSYILGQVGFATSSWIFIILFPILAFLGMYIASLIGQKFLFIYQAAKFFLVGVLNTLIDIGVLSLLIDQTNIAKGLFYSVFKAISFLVATTNSYFWNKFWTFEKREDVRAREFLKFLIVATVGFVINVGVASVVVNVFGPKVGISEKIWAMLGAVVAAFFAFIWNFLASKFIVFKKYNMLNLVLYRKYRPQSFSEIIGQEHIVQTLTNALSAGMISHAYLFHGPRGSGKTTIARLMAKAVNCENRKEKDFEPCNKCSSCLEIMASRSMDLIEIDAASHRGIDEIRELRDGIRFAPVKSKYKVFIIDESHQLTKEAANALLKTLEEPPSHAIFILATTEIHKMIPTIISRCQRFDFRKLTIPEIIKRLEIISKKEGVKIEKPALELIALNSGGAIRDAESLLDQALTFSGTIGREREIKAEDIKDILGLVEVGLIQKFTEFISQKKASETISFLNEIYEKGADLQEFNKTLINYLRQALILKITGVKAGNPIITGLTKEEFQKLEIQAQLFQESDIRKMLDLFLDAENKMKYSPITQLPLELAIIESCGLSDN